MEFRILKGPRLPAHDLDPVSSPTHYHLHSQAWQRAFSLEGVGAGEGRSIGEPDGLSLSDTVGLDVLEFG